MTATYRTWLMSSMVRELGCLSEEEEAEAEAERDAEEAPPAAAAEAFAFIVLSNTSCISAATCSRKATRTCSSSGSSDESAMIDFLAL